MPYDREIEQAIRSFLGNKSGLTSRAMFGGIGYLVGGNMALGIYKDNLVVRLGSPERAREEIDSGRALPFDITGRAMKGWVMVPKTLLTTPADYRMWLEQGLGFARSLPPKQ